jgi:hypothetical protein
LSPTNPNLRIAIARDDRHLARQVISGRPMA